MTITDRDVSAQRLRSERSPSTERQRRVAQNQADCAARRAAFYDQTRRELMAEIGATAMGITQRSLIDSCAITVVEVSELSSIYLRGRASSEQMAQLGNARSQLARLLSLLGLPRSTNNGAGVVQSIDDLRREYSNKREEES